MPSFKKSLIVEQFQGNYLNTAIQSNRDIFMTFKGLFTWKEGAPANRATRLEGLKRSPPLHATHLPGTVSGLRELPFERALSTTNKETFFHLISASCTGTGLFSP